LPHWQTEIFAVLGSAGVMGGISRMVLSLTAVLVEVTGHVRFLPYFAVTLLVAQFVANCFNAR
jgi:H+/Cl- antiporter ClcA